MSGRKDILLGKIRNQEPMTLRQQAGLVGVLSFPAIMSQLTTVLVNIIDTAMVGHLGNDAAASTGLVSSTLWLFGSIAMAALMGFCVPVAQKIGAKSFSEARNLVRQGFVSMAIGGLLVCGVALAISERLPFWLGGSESIATDATVYFRTLAAFMPVLGLSWFCSHLLQASGNMKTPSILNISLCVMDVIFNYIFIYQMDMGVFGAALGTVLAEAITSIPMMWFLLVKSPELNLLQDKGRWWPEKKNLKEAAGIAAPIALQGIIMQGAQIMSTVIIAPLGNLAIKAHTFAISVESLCYMPGHGVETAATTLVGQSLGAKRPPLARRFAFLSMGLGAAVMTVLGVVMFIFAEELMSIMTDDAAVIGLGALCLRIEAFAETMYAVSMVGAGSCIGAGDALASSMISLASMWFVRITLALLLVKAFGMGLEGYWIAMCAELNFRGILFICRVRGNKWMKKFV